MGIACPRDETPVNVPLKAPNPSVYVSTFSLAGGSLEESLNRAAEAGITRVELSSSAQFEPDLDGVLRTAEQTGMRFLVHNYFPAPREPFVLNLASASKETRQKSVEHCRRAIDLSQALDADFYSVHAGFAFEVAVRDLGANLRPRTKWPLRETYLRFVDSVRELVEYGASRRVRLLIENHVLTRSNLVENRNELLLMVRSEELLELRQDISSPWLGFLIDVGHLAVSAATLEFKPEDFLRQVASHTVALHLSDNDTKMDQNMPFRDDAWFIPYLRMMRESQMILECRPAPSEVLLDCCRTIQQALHPRSMKETFA